MSRGITKVTFTDEIDCPAAIWMHSGHLLLHPQLWGDLAPDQRLFVILHELGHRVLQTDDELAADRWASDQFLNSYGGSPRASVLALADGLNFSTPEHSERAMAQLERAYYHDQRLQRMEAQDLGYSQSFQSFLGLGKAAKAKREERQADKDERRDLKNAKKEARVNVINSRAEKNAARSEFIKNKKEGGGAAGLLSQGLAAVGDIFGKGGGASDDSARVSGSVDFNSGATEEPPKKDNTMLYVGIAVAVVVVVVVLVMVLGKKKPSK